MDPEEVKRQSVYPTIALGFTIIIIIFLFLSVLSLTSGSNSLESTIQIAEASKITLNSSLTNFADQIRSIISAGNSADVLISVESQIRTFGLTIQTDLTNTFDSLKQSLDKINNGRLTLWIGIVSTLLVLVFQIVSRKNYLVLVDEFFSVVEKYRQLLSTKKILEVELQNARQKVTDLRSMLELSKTKIADLDASLEAAQIRIQNLEKNK